MDRRRCLLGAVLVYVALDLSVAAIPGAFVFEITECVEAVYRGWNPRTADPFALPSPSPESSLVTPRPREPRVHLRPVRETPRRHAPVPVRLRAATAAAARSSEDPH